MSAAAISHYQNLFDSNKHRSATAEQAWQQLLQQGFPSRRQEAWKYLNLQGLLKQNFSLPTLESKNDAVNAAEVIDGALVITIINGQLHHSAVLPPGVTVVNQHDLPGELLQRFANEFAAEAFDNPFVALNSALNEQTLYVHVAAGTAVNTPIVLHFHCSASGDKTTFHPKVKILLEKDSRAEIVQHFTAVHSRLCYFNNVVVNVCLLENAGCELTKIVEEADAAYHMAEEQLRLASGSYYQSNRLLLQGLLIRDNAYTLFAGEKAEVVLNGVYCLQGKQQVDMQGTVSHAVAQCKSSQFYKGLVDGKAKAIFNGKVLVGADAQKSQSSQNNNTLLLSSTAEIDSKPELQIYADDVSCTHGATVGDLDAQQLFYLQSRGINAAEARQMLIFAFVEKVVAQVNNEQLRKQLMTKVQQLLQQRFQAI